MHCGGPGRLFRGLLTIVDSCSVCGLDLRGNDAGAGPAVFVILIAGFIVCGALAIVDPLRVGLSVLGALVLNMVLAINHRPGRYFGQ